MSETTRVVLQSLYIAHYRFSRGSYFNLPTAPRFVQNQREAPTIGVPK